MNKEIIVKKLLKKLMKKLVGLFLKLEKLLKKS